MVVVVGAIKSFSCFILQDTRVERLETVKDALSSEISHRHENLSQHFNFWFYGRRVISLWSVKRRVNLTKMMSVWHELISRRGFRFPSVRVWIMIDIQITAFLHSPRVGTVKSFVVNFFWYICVFDFIKSQEKEISFEVSETSKQI